ncbi:related to peroxiredoxin q [Ustilago trichophora]|uniref:thioredoxin-dependent peroxiredoxin n=1 Tax=Ustilago trichophora TaxID=86804 RepID=A0A5C3EAI3_9BASI|nr:related to peroxiredoxin q [Ustilago trichophora]
MPHLPRVPAFPIAGERSILTAAGAALKIPAKEKNSPLIGHPAPEIIAKDHLGRDVSLHATIELGRPIVLYFFPLAGSPHCTKESCSFRDAVGASPIFNDLNALVIGISQDPPSRSKRFVDEHHLGFRILHDSNRQIMDAWGVGRGLLGLIDGRCTFIIDHEGVVRAMLDGVWDYQGHRNFAEKWLCRIEHELSGRERFYMEHDADDSVACDELTRNVKVVYGDAIPSRGIASAPRHGAAPAAAKSKKSNTNTSSKPLQDPKSTSLSIAAEANASGSVSRVKSRRNLKAWLRPNASSNGMYDEPLHVDYKFTNRSFDDVSRDRQRQSKIVDPAARAARSTDKVAARVRSLRLDEQPDGAMVNVKDFADQRSPHSRQGSGSGSGWATPSTISARSISTGETSHTSPGPGSRDSAHAATLAAAIKNGIAASSTELERSTSARRREVMANGNGVTASNSIVTSARSSSLLKKASIENASAVVAAAAADASIDSRLTLSPDAFGKAEDVGTVYANGNIARMPLLPSAKGERSVDSMATVTDRRGRDASSDSAYSTAAGASSLPVPPRPSARNVTAAGGAVAAAASARLQKQAMPSSPTTSQTVVSGTAAVGEESGEAQPNGTQPPSGPESTRKPSLTNGTTSTSKTTPTRRPLPPQPAAPHHLPPPTPPSPSITWSSRAPLRTTNGHPSPSLSTTFAHHTSYVGIDEAKAQAMERRHSNTPSLSASMMSAYDQAASEYEYSPSIADSTHTFGGVEIED